MSRGTGCGKVILIGEHAVVHGVPALAVGIDRGATASTAEHSGPAHRSELFVRGWNITVYDEEEPSLGRAFRDLLAVTGTNRPVRIEAEADLPPGGGLGCSAALGVAVARALDSAASPETIAERVMAWERVWHGNPSGVDAAVSSLGGCVLFQRGEPGAHARIERVRVPGTFHVVIGHTGVPSSTKTMVEGVARLRAAEPERVGRAFEAIASLVRAARPAIEGGDARGLGELLDRNHAILSRELAVSTDDIERLCDTARSAGALGAKLTGAGGGGCVAALVEDPARGSEIVEAWKRIGFHGFVTSFGAPPHPVSTRRLSSMEGSP